MLIIRKVLAASVITTVLLCEGATPALAKQTKPRQQPVPKVTKVVAVKENFVSVRLSHTDVRASRSSARRAISSQYAQYFDAETLAFMTVYARGWNLHQWSCLRKLWTAESHFNPKAANPHSSAYGIAQLLSEKSVDARHQINAGLNYIQERYGSACNAWYHEIHYNWY